MKTIGECYGRTLRTRFGLGPRPVEDAQLVAIARSLGLCVQERDLVDVREVWASDLLVINSRLPREQRRWLLAHGIGHHALHIGNLFVLPTATIARQEREADLLAGAMLLGDSARRMDRAELAAYHQLPEEALTRWFGLRAGTFTFLGHWHRQFSFAHLPGAKVGYLARSG